MSYHDFIKTKLFELKKTGFECGDLSPMLFDYQKDLVRWALNMGRCALFTMTGTGKTIMQCEWAKRVQEKTQGSVLLVSPLAVSSQTIREGKKIGLEIRYCKNQSEVKSGISITNYERLESFTPGYFTGIVLDESSILKSFTSSTRDMLVHNFKDVQYKLACTATPAPNDFMELGNHAEFLNVMTRNEMLSMFFVHDGGDTSKWRLKGHAATKFWQWVASWAAILNKPSDLGYSDKGFDLPPLNVHNLTVSSTANSEFLFAMEAQTLEERRAARKDSLSDRVKICADMVNESKEPFLVWCDLNSESEMLRKLIKGAVEVKGSDDSEYKEKSLLLFSDNQIRVLISKPSICGHGMNWQHCNKMAFVGLSDSFEQYFQAVRRCWRFKQTKPVDVYVITSEAEGAVVNNIKRKEADAMRMIMSMVEHTSRFVKDNIKSGVKMDRSYEPGKDMVIPAWLKSEQGEY